MEPRATTTRSSRTAGRSTRTPAGRANALLLEIRRQLKAGEIRKAKQLASEAVRSHPAHAGLLSVDRMLNEGQSFTSPATGRDMRLEYEWLHDPPAKYRGQWVALVGGDVVGAGTTLEELQASLPRDLGQTPLAVRIPA